MGSEIIYCVYHNKTLRDPVSVLIVSVAVTLMVLTILSLYSSSILTDLPLIGDCSNPLGNVFLIVITFHLFFICFSVGLIATVQFLTKSE